MQSGPQAAIQNWRVPTGYRQLHYQVVKVGLQQAGQSCKQNRTTICSQTRITIGFQYDSLSYSKIMTSMG